MQHSSLTVPNLNKEAGWQQETGLVIKAMPNTNDRAFESHGPHKRTDTGEKPEEESDSLHNSLLAHQ